MSLSGVEASNWTSDGEIAMNLEKYKHIGFTTKPNKNKIPVNDFTFESLEEFNKIYKYAKKNFLLVKPTRSQGISYNISERYHERYFVISGNQRFELVIVCVQGCYRFLLHNKRPLNNSVNGREACKEMYKYFDKYNIDLAKYANTSEEGKEIKKQIESPHIKCIFPGFIGFKLKHVYHIDFKSSYASRICEAYPELKEMYTEIFNKRKEDDGYFKHILTNSIGAWQSLYCVDYRQRFKTVPFQFANLSKTAINGTRAKLEEMLVKLKDDGMIPLLTNTDGIWYYSPKGAYHDENEGNQLGNWNNDHVNCEFLMTSAGSYQYVENGVCHSVVRGLCSLDLVESDRSKWKFGDIFTIKQLFTYKLDLEEGVIKTKYE